MSDWQKLRRLERAELGLLATAAILLPLIGLSLRFVSLRTMTATLGTVERRRARRPLSVDSVARLTGVAARRGFVTPSCIVRSVALQHLLARHGHPAHIRFGARKDEGQLMAHAWVECAGRRLLESGEPFPAFTSVEGPH